MKHKLFLASLMLLFCTILSAETYNGTCGAQGNNLTWTLDTETGTLTISGTGEMKKYNYYGYALWYSSCSSIKTIIIENGVSSIGNYAFNKCSSLTSITIPNSVTTIGERAFSDCSSLTSITIPNSVTSIGFRAFDNCSSLTSVTIPNSVTSIGQNAFDGCSGLNAVHISDLAAWCKISFGLDDANPLHYAHNLYLNGKLVTDLTIPNSITSIGNRAFDGCRSLTSVTIPNSVTSIGNFAFDGCSSLTSVTIPNSVTSIGNYAFFGCSSLTSITIPNSVTSIGSYAFYNVLNITYNGTATDSPWGAKCVNGFVDGCFVYSDATKTNLLGCSNAKGDITIPNSVTSIGSGAFSGCSGLTSVTIPNSVTSIGSGAFNNVQNIAYSGIATGSPWGAKSVNGFVDGYFVYSDASKTNLLGCSTAVEGEVTIPNSVTSIGSYAFAGCRSLTSVTIPNSVTSIGNYAFSFCSGLTSVTIGNSVTSIGFSAFDGCYNLNEVHISDLAVWCKISSANLGNPLLYAHNLYLNGELVTDLVIPNNVTSIGNYAFDGCSSLTSITIPNSVTSIGNYAFSGCSGLTSVTIPNSITSIGENAFEECKKLTAVYITDLTAWCKISFSINNSFPSYSCNPLYYAHNLYLNGKLVTNLVIPNSVTSIGAYAFYGCSSLTSVTIPNSVTSIGEGAFYNVLNIVYSGSATGSPWGAKNVNGFVDGYFVYSDATKTNLQRCSSSIKGDLVIPNGVTSIGNSAFSGCSSLTSIQIPNSVTSIGDEAFNYCSSLTSITIPNSVTSIGDKTFYYCHSLTSVTIPNSVTSIGDKTFYYCGSLSSVTIPNSVKRIGSSAFEGCRDLQHIYIYTETPPSISSSTFEYIHSDAVVYVPVGSLSTYQAAAYWKDMNIKEMVFYDTICETKPTSVTITLRQYIWEMNNHRIVSCGMEGGEEFEGSTLEYIGLEPESEYEDIPIVMTSNIGETSTVNISFTTSALTLTTLASKAVSANTAILLAETNMSDAETSCGFEWRRNDQPEDMPSNQVLCPVANGLLAGRLKGLRDDTYYKYRAFYKSAAGNMFYGDWQYIFTGDVAVEFDPVLYTYAAQFVSERKATLKGYALPGADDFTEQGFEYWAESRRTNAPARRAPQYAIGEKHTVTGTGISMRVTLEDLDEGTVYKYRTYAKVGGKTLYGSEMTFTTEGEWIEYTLTANSDDAAAGSVTGSGTYHTGTEVSIEAVPATGYRFVRWQDDNTDNPRTIVLTEDMTFTAYFERIPDALEETDTDRTPSAKKVYENGQLYILLPDGTRYNLQGMEVK